MYSRGVTVVLDALPRYGSTPIVWYGTWPDVQITSWRPLSAWEWWWTPPVGFAVDQPTRAQRLMERVRAK